MKINPLKKSESLFLKIISGVFFINIAGIIAVWGLNIFLARKLGVEQFGIFVYVTALLNIFVIISLFGFDNVIVRYGASYNVLKQWDLLKGLLRFSDHLILIITSSISIVGLILLYAIRHKLNTDLFFTLCIACFISPFLSLIYLRQALLQSYRMPIKALIPNKILRPLFLFLLVLFFVILNKKLLSFEVMLLSFLNVVLVYIIIHIWCKKTILTNIYECDYREEKKEWISVSFPMWIIASMRFSIKQIDIILVGGILGTTMGGIYAISSKLTTLIAFAFRSVNFYIAPQISHFYATNNKKELQKQLSYANKYSFVFALIVTIIMFFSGESLLSFFGVEFRKGATVLKILIFSQLINAATGPVNFFMIMTKYQKEAARFLIVCGLFSIVLNIILIPKYEIVGAAIASTIGFSLLNIMISFYIYRKEGIHTSIFYWIKKHG